MMQHPTPKTARHARSIRDLLFVRCPRRVRRALRWRAGSVSLSSHQVAYRPLALLAGALLSASTAWANPSGAQVVAGTVNIVSSVPHTLDIRQGSDKAIINWTSFSIASGETVNFVQPTVNSVTLNRVLGNDPSAIFGRLNANGTVMLVNPNGIVFGPTARVDVGGLIATTANLRDDDFLAGRYQFGEASTKPQARIVNQGEITIKNAGLAALVAPSVQNAGVIQARLGQVVLGGVATFALDFQGDGLLSFSAGQAVAQRPLDANGQPVNALVDNTGTVSADGGTVLMTARAVQGVIDQVINTSGIVSATAVGEQGGRIVLSGGDGSSHSGQVVVSGQLDASGRGVGQRGGQVVATGEQVKLTAGAQVDVSGRSGGGEIALGSDGLASGYANKSRTTSVAAGAQLHADALDQGDGGTVTVWSQETTRFAGALSARGGAQGGNGGFAEVSSQKNIALSGSVDLRAPQGATGTLLLDPTDLRITDSASGGSQDGNAVDGSIAVGDADQSLNTVSRGVLENMAGNANITLQATGQITIDAMAGQLIDLQTTTGNSFTLQSTQSGGIRFTDATTEIRTQGGNITLEAQGIGSTLANIGQLTSNGGAVTLKASGDIELAGDINAGSGAVSLQTTVGSIANAAATSPLLSGGAVSLSALGGHVGAAGDAIATHTTSLTLASGGHLVAASDTALATLAITANHVAPTDANDYQVSAPGLTFQLSDGAALGVTDISQAPGLNLSLTSDRSVQLGTVNVGTGTLTLGSTGGNLLGAADTALTAASLTLSAQGSNGNNGAIGTSGQSLLTTAGHVDATSGSGGVYLANTGALALDRLSTTGSSNVTATGTLTAGDVSAGSATLALGSSGASVLDDGSTTTRITAGTLNLTAGGAIGSSGTRVSTNASTVSANAASGGIYASTSATSSVLSSIVSGDGAIDIQTGGSTTLTSLTSSTSSANNDITVAATGTGSLSVGTVNAGSLGDVTLSTTSGSISGNSGLITGNTVTLNAANSGSVSVRTAASHLDVQAGSSSISITQTGSVVLDRIATPSTVASVTSSSGDITVGSVSTSTSGQVSLTASAGSIFDDGNSSTRITTGTASLSASAAIGDATNAVQTKATGLAVTSTGDLFVSNAEATLTSLSITNRHSAPGHAGTLQVDSPYLTFNVTDTGTSYTLDQVVSVPLGTLAFSGDATLQIGQVQAAGSVSLTATQGHIADDGNLNSRVTSGSTLTLSAAQGSVGSSSNPIGVNASSLALTTRGDLYVTDLTDLSTLTVTSNHPDTTTSYGMAITAPSLMLSVSDSAAGHAVQTLTDTSSLSLTFTSDRDITLGQVDVTHTGTARFTSSAGNIKDDGDKSTRVLANSTTLSGRAVGAAGTDHMDVVTGTLAATASAGGVYVEVPMPTGSTNTTSTVTLGTITATGPVAITALEGDLSLGGFMTATNQSVTLTASEGSILSPSGYSIAIGTGSLVLDATQSIGTSSRALPVTSSTGATLTAQAGTSMFASSSGPMTLASLDAATSISYTQSSGAITVGHVDATAGGTVAITATTGAIQNDSDAATGIRANQVTLSAAQSSIGSGTALTVDTPKLLVTANGAIGVTDSATLDTLSVTRGSGSSGAIAISGVSGQSFTLSEDGTEHYVESVDSSTPLAFSFSGQRNVKIGHIDVGAAGSASISSAASLTNDGVSGSSIAAGTVSLSAGTAGSIGATGSGNAISLEGTTALTLSTGRNAFVASDAALTDLTVTSTNTTTASGTASVFDVSGLNQTFGITDSGTTQSLDFSGTALTNASFTTRKNIAVGAISATGDVTLTTTGGGANSNISSDSGSGRIAGNRVLLTATSSTAGGGSIGSSGTALRVDTPTLILSGSGNVYVNDAQNLARLDMTLSHGTNTTFGYQVSAGNLNSFTVTDGSTQSIGLAVSGAMDFSYSVDRALSLATLDAGTSTTGSISLTSRSAPSGTGAQINRSSGSLTGGTITLSATGSNGGVGAGATLSTNTKNLRIATGGNVSVSNSTTLTSLSLDARHNTSGSSTHSYSISSTGLTFSISDTLGSNAFQLSNITQTSLDLSVKADRVITANSVNTGAGGKVTLQSSSYVQGGSAGSAGSPNITTGDLTLNGGSAFGYQGSTPLYTAASTLSSSLSNTLYLSNAGALTLKTNTVGSSADVASSNNSLLQGSGGLFTTPTLKLSANQSLGSNDTLLTDARRLTLVGRNHIDVSNASDLYALTMTSTHATAGVQNTISVAAPRLALTLTDSVGGNQYHLSNLVDSTGLDFTLSTDVDLNLGTVNAQAGRSLALYSTGSTTSITNDGSSLLTAGSLLLSAGGSIGAAGGSGTRMQTDALALTLATGANAYADNAQDLTSLSLTSSQTAGGTAPVYQVTAPSLSFDLTDDGSTHINNLADSTGLNFVLNTQRDQAVGSIDVGRSGTVSLTGTGDILGDADSSHRISAASATFYASNGGAIGSVGNPIRLSAPLTSFAPTGALNVESDTHIDSLTISTTHPTVSYGGTYSIVSVPITGAAYSLFTATDSVTGTALTSLDDPLGLAFSFTSDAAMQVGTLNLGTTGTVALTGTGSGGILGDGDPNTLVQAASLSMTSYGGAVGATGSGNGIDATVNTVSATAQGGGVNLALHGRTTLGTISATGGVNLTNDEGDIALGVIDAGGNAVGINNQGGSILSGAIANATTVSLTASGSIGNTSAIGTSANGGGTTTLTASASAAHGATGSIAISESYNLFASSVTAPADVTLSSGYDLSVGTVTSGGAVALSASQGSINGINSSNAITGTSVNLSASYGTGNGLGSSLVRLNVNTPQLVLNTPGSVYVTDSADLNLLTVDRTDYTGTGSSGTLSVIASGLTFSATDSSDTTTLTSLADGTGLDFTYLGIGSLSVGSLNVGAGSVLLQAYLSDGDGNINAINGSSLITAGSLTLQAYGTGSNIGSSGTALGLAVGSLTASSGTGGMVLQQAGSLNLSSLATTGALAVTTTSGDLTLGTLSYGSANTLSLSASGGSILAGGGTLAGSGANAAITLSAANGIGTAAAPILVNGSAGHTLNASVTGTGSLYLSSLSTLNGGLTTSVHDGATTVTAAGSIKLTSMSSGTDAAGNDIRVTASAGDITAVSVSGGSDANFNAVTLSANAGRLLAAPGATLEGFDVTLHGATGVGSSTDRVSANGQRVQVSSAGGAIYLTAASPSVLSSVASAGGAINITHSADLLLANALSSGGAITVASTTANADLIAGNLNAGSGALTLSSSGAGGTLQDDGNRSTSLTGGTVSLTGTGGVGTASLSVQTSATTLNASSGNGIFIDDSRSAGVTLASVVATGGAVSVSSAGPTVATLVQASADSAGNDVTLATSSGDLTLVSVTAGANHGAVNVSSAGSILASGSGTHITGHSATLAAGEDIGVVTNLTTGAGTPVKLDVSALTSLSSSGTNRVVSVLNTGSTALSLGGSALSLGSGSSAYISTAGDLDVSAGITLANGNLSLDAGGTLLLPTTAISTTGAVRLSGSTDILTSGSGAAARDLHVSGSSLVLASGAAGGDTRLTTTVGSIEATLSGAGDLSVTNTGTLSAATLATSDGDITATSSTGMTAGSVVAGGSGRAISLTATAGNLSAGTVNAGSGGSITLSAAQGALSGASATLTASTLDLTSGNGIGSSGAAFGVNAANVSAQVTGTGGVYLSSGSALTLGNLSTNDGDIAITAAGNLTAGAMSAGQSGNVALTSTGGNVTLTQAYTQAGSDSSRAGLSLQGQALSVAAVSTTGAQSYTGALTVGGNLSASAITVNGGATLSGGARTLAGSLHITGTLAGGGNAATLNAGSGSVVLDGAASGLASLNATGASIQVANVTTTGGAQTYQGATTLNGSYATQGGAFSVTGAAQLGGATSVATSGGQASFGSTLDGAASLGLSTGAGNASFGGAVGQTTRLSSLTLTSAGATRFEGAVAAGSLSTDAAGTLAVNGGSVNTTGAQSYGERMVLGSDTVLTGSTVTLVQGADATVAGQQGLTVTGNAVLPTALGANAALKSLSISGDTSLDGGAVTTTGAQTYSGAVALGADTQLTGTGISFGSSVNGAVALTVQAGSGAASFSAVGDTTRLGALTVNSSGATTLGGTVRAASVSTDAAGTLAINGGSVHTTGTQNYGETAVLGSDTTLTGTTITLAEVEGTTAGSQALTISGDAVLGAVGSTTALSQLSVSGNSTLNGNVATSGSQTYTGAATLGSDVALATNGGELTFTSSVDGAHALTIGSGAGDVAFNGAVGGTTRVGALTINSSGATTLAAAVNAASVSTDAAGTLALNGSTVNTTGTQSYGEAAVLGSDTTLTGSTVSLAGADGTHALTISGNAVLGSLGTTTALSQLAVNGTSTLNSDVTTTGSQAYTGAVTLGNDVALSTTGGAVTFTSTVDGAHALTIGSGAGDVTFNGAVGSTTRVGDLTVNSSGATTFASSVAVASVSTDAAGTLALNGGAINTTGTQSYGEAAVLGSNTTLTGTTVTLAGVEGTTAGSQALTISGNAVLGAVGSSAALSQLSVSGNSTLNGNVATSGSQTYTGAATLGSDVALATNGGELTFTSSVDGAHALTIDSGTGDVAFNGAVGGTTRLGALAINSSGATTFASSVAAASVSTDAAGTLAINGGAVNTTGAQTYGETAVLGSDTTLTGATVTLASVQGSTAGGQSLTVSGHALLGAAGTTTTLSQLAISGTSALSGNVATTGGQTYTGAMTLGSDIALSTTGGDVSFTSTVDGAHALTINSSAGNVAFNGAVGGTARLGALAINSNGATTFASSVAATSVNTDAPGTLALNGGTVNTTGTQSYGEAAVLGASTTLTGSTVTLAGADGAHALSISGNAVLGAVGSTTALSQIAVSGTTALNGSVTTTGSQSFTGAVTLGSDVALGTTDSAVTFTSTVDGAQALTIGSGAGDVAFNGAVGSNTRLGDLTVNSSGATTFDSSVAAASVSTDAAGSLALNGGAVHTTGTQTYGEAAALGADTTLTGTTVSLAGAEGAHALSISGNAVLGTLGATTALSQLTLSGTAALNGNVITTGGQTYTGAVTLGGGVALSTTDSAVTFTSTVDGAHALTIGNGAGDVTFNGAVGSTTRVGDLTVNSSGATTFAGSVAVASVSTDAAGTLALNGGSVHTTGTQTYGETVVLGSDTTLTGSTVTLAGAEGAHTLNISGGAVLGTLGATTALTQLAISGTSMLNSDVTTTGSQTYTGAVTLGGDVALSTTGSEVTFSSTLDGAQTLTIGSGTGDVAFNGAVGSTLRVGALTVNSSGATTFGGAVQAASVSTNAAGTLALNGGAVHTTGTQAYGETVVLGSDTTLTGTTVTLAGVEGSTAGGQALTLHGHTVAGPIGATTALNQITLNDSTTLNGPVRSTGNQVFNGALTLGTDTTLATSGGHVALNGTVSGAHALTVNSSGTTTFGGAVNVASVSTDAAGSLALNGGTITTTGAQTYGDTAVLGTHTTLTGATVTLAGVEGSTAGGQALTIDGNAVLGPVGTTTALSQLALNGTATLNGAVRSTGSQAFQDVLTLGQDVTLSTSGGDVTFASSVDGAQALTIGSGAGNVAFNGTVGGTTRIGALTVNSSGGTAFGSSVAAASVTTDAAGGLALNGGAVHTTGAQTYGDTAALGGDTTLTGSTVSLAGVEGHRALTISGNAVLGDLGATAALSQLAVSGTSLLTGRVATTGGQTYAGAVTLGHDVALSTTGGAVTFSSTLDGAQALTIGSGAGNVAFNGAIGNTSRVGALTVNSSGATTFGSSVAAASVTTDAAGTLALNGGAVHTTGTQTYGESAALGASTTLTGTTVSLAGVDGAQALTISGNAVLGHVGATTALSQLSVSGSSTLNGDVITSGSQAYSGAVTLGNDVALSTSGGDVTFNSSIAGAHALTLNSSGATTFGGAVNVASVTTDAAGTLALNGGTITTTGAQTYSETAVLGANTTLTGTSVSLAGANGAHTLSISGDAVLGTLGTTTALSQLVLSGSSTLNGDVITSGGQAYTGAVTLGSDVALTTSGGNLAFASSISGAQALTVNSSGATTFGGAIDVASVTTDAAGSLALRGGAVTTTGAQTYGETAVLGANTTLTGTSISLAGVEGAHSLTISGNAVLGHVGTTTALSQLVISGSSALSGNVITSGGQAYTGVVTLGSDVALTTRGGNVTFASSIGGAHALTVNSSGATTFGGAVDVASVSTDAAGSLAVNGGAVTTTGAQTYGETAVLGTDTTLTGTTVSLAGVEGAHTLTISGNALLGDVGTSTAVSQLSISGSSTLNGNVVTSGGQTYAGAVTLGHDVALSTTGGAVTFSSTLDGAQALTIGSATGNVAFNGAIGNTSRVGALTVNSSGATTFGSSVAAASVTTDAAGTLALNGGAVHTTGTQTYGESAALGASTTLTGTTISLAGVDGAQALTISGNAVLGHVGATTALSQLSVSGSSTLNGDVITSGSQAYSGAVTLGNDVALSTSGGDVTFNSSIAGAHALTLNSSGATTFGGAVNVASVTTDAAGSLALHGGAVTTTGAQTYSETAVLGANTTLTGTSVSLAGVAGAHALTINSSGSTTFSAAVNVASVTTDAAGSLALNGGAVTTTGAQTYGETAVLGADTTLTGSTVTLAGVQGHTAGGQSLSIAGQAVIGDAGTSTALSQLAVSGTSTLNGHVITSGGQSYAGAVTLGSDVALTTTTDGDVTFASSIGGAQALTVNSSGATTFGGAVDVASVTTDAAGSLALKGGSITTTGAQTYGETAQLGHDTMLTASTVSLLAGVDAATDAGQALAIVGDATIGGAIGTTHALAALSVSGAATLAAGHIATAGDQSYAGAVMLNGDQQLHSRSGAIHFASTLDAASRANLSLSADAGAIGIDGAVGAQAALGALTVHAGTTLDFGASLKAYRLTQTGAGGLAHFRGTVFIEGLDGLSLTGQAFAFDQAVTATTGALQIVHTNGTGTGTSSTVFARDAAVSAATGFTQVGGGNVLLPASIHVAQGPITLAAPATLYAGNARIETQGDITMTGLAGPATALTLASGHGPYPAGTTPLPVAGKLVIGHDDGHADHQINVANLAVPDASAATLFGIIGGQGGALAASRINSYLVNDPFYINLTPWGPVEVINLLVATTVPSAGVPSTPGAASLFTGTVPQGGVTPNALAPYVAPPVLQVLQVQGPAPLLQPSPEAVEPTGQAPLQSSRLERKHLDETLL